MNTNKIPITSLERIDYCINRLLARCLSVMSYIAENDRLCDLFEDVNEISQCIYAAQCYISLLKAKKNHINVIFNLRGYI